MPVDEDYGRRQVILPHASPVQCPASCPVSSGDRFLDKGSERFQTEKIEPPERFQNFGAERSSSDRLPSGERYHGSERYPLGDRPTTAVSNERLQRYADRYASENIGSLDRYHSHATLDRYPRPNTSTDRYHTLSGDKERCNGRYTPDRYSCSMERYARNQGPERKFVHERYRYEQYQNYPAIPCPERFATNQERISYTQVPYMEPPSPAPASDRFIPPPPLSPEDTPSPDCYPSNPFPSPTNSIPMQEKFIPPPPLSPSPTEPCSPKKQRFSPVQNDRYQFHERGKYYDRYSIQPGYHTERFLNPAERFATIERALPSNPHAPVERYVPQEAYYGNYQNYERYPKFNPNTDPYMRRDLGYHYRLPYTQNPYQRIRYANPPNRAKCCQYQEGYQLSKSSPGSSSSSSVTSQGREILNMHPNQECQNYHAKETHYQQEKAIQCNNLIQTKELSVQCPGYNKECPGFTSPNLRGTKCRHNICVSPGVEYVGQAGGRRICATPPPRGSIGSTDGSICSDQCCTRRSQNALTVWRPPTSQQSTSHTPQTQSPQKPPSPVPPQPTESEAAIETVPDQHEAPSPVKNPQIQRAISLPASPAERYRTMPERGMVDYSLSERTPNRERPTFARSTSRKEAIKNFIKKETANFFGVDEDSEADQQLRWLDRRKRMASRTYGPLKDEYQAPRPRSLRRTVSEAPGPLYAERPDVLPGPSDVTEGIQDRWGTAGIRRKDSVARMTWDGLSYVVTTLTRHRPRQRSQTARLSRSYLPDSSELRSTTSEDDMFFEPPIPATPTTPEGRDIVDHSRMEGGALEPLETPVLRHPRSATPGWRRDPQHVGRARGEQTRTEVGCSRIFSSLLDSVLDNSNRRQYGMGWVGRMFGRSMRRSVAQDEVIQQQLDDLEDHRPYFTYWVTSVQILVLIISLICYGFGPYGVDLQSRSGQVLVTSLSLQQVDYLEPANFWLGPRAADLIHLGAKFAPCMRVDDKVMQEIDRVRARERETACCIRNDDSGCVQSSRADCSNTISTWKKWSSADAGPGGRISGSVCGLDPKYCDAPASIHPYEWPDDITKWPICRKMNTQFSLHKGSPKDKSAEHMICEVIGHPCCIGIHGQCRITTKEYCDFVRGTFHEEASLCSQVSCLDDVCGMIPFYFMEVPDQFYRLWTSLFLHAGILQLCVTVLIQYFLMRDLEKLTGSLRIAVIYIGSGVAGNLASAIFVPYRADVGPAGSQFGLLACLIVEVLNAWPMLKHPNQALCKLLSITLFLFMIGLLPWVDNYAHLFGFVFGFLISYAFLPFISFGHYDRQKKVVLIWVCLVSAGFLFICLVLLFYIIPVYDCEVCSYFNCLPITRDFCASQNINFKREEPVV